MKALSGKIPEEQLIIIWQKQLFDVAGLITENGELVKIIYPGRLNNEQGPDFRDVVIAIGAKIKKGDVEVHIKSSDWKSHHHHQDPVYNRVIMHVVLWHNTRMNTKLQDGNEVPVLALEKNIKIPFNEWPDIKCSADNLDIPCKNVARRVKMSDIVKFLDEAGKERFLVKSARFQREIAKIGPSQSIYQGIMGALGYSKNKLPCLELSRRLPLQILESVIQDKISDSECLARQQALLLGTAGLIHKLYPDYFGGDKPDDELIIRLEKLWNSYNSTEAMSPGDWQLFKVRPNNSPARRLVAMSYLLLRYREKGLMEGLIQLVDKVPIVRGYHILERGLLVTAGGYRAGHFDMGVTDRLRSPSLIGAGRAADIAVNVLLPFIFAWGKINVHPELTEKAFELYRSYPRLAENNIERHMTEQIGLRRGLVKSAIWQQGLIHTYYDLCTQGMCNQCLLSQLQVWDNIQV